MVREDDEHPRDDRALELLLALAEEALPAEEHAAGELELASLGEHEEALERQRYAVQAIREVTPLAPVALRADVERQLRGERRPRRRQWAFRPALAVSLAVVLAIVVVGLIGVKSDQPTVAEAATFGTLLAEGPPPPPEPSQPAMLAKVADGVRFPDWEREFGWRANGVRNDRLDGRRAETVFYGHDGHRVAYTVVSGPPLEPPPEAQEVVVDGVRLHLFRDDRLDAYRSGARDVATFERNGRTCVLSGHVLRRSTMVKLATWRADGAVTF